MSSPTKNPALVVEAGAVTGAVAGAVAGLVDFFLWWKRLPRYAKNPIFFSAARSAFMSAYRLPCATKNMSIMSRMQIASRQQLIVLHFVGSLRSSSISVMIASKLQATTVLSLYIAVAEI